jgi:hypothetical protein
MLWEEYQTSKNKPQTQVVGGKQDLLCYWTSTLDLSKNAPALQLMAVGFYGPECGSKKAGRRKANVAVSLLLGSYNLSY